MSKTIVMWKNYLYKGESIGSKYLGIAEWSVAFLGFCTLHIPEIVVV